MRLIDADLAKKQCEEDGDIAAAIWLDNQPTAYDINKVMEQLKENSHAYKTEPDDLGDVTIGHKVYLKDAMEIVKSGGVE